MATFEEFYGALDPDPGIRGKQFEHFVKWFLKTDPEWSSQIERIWLWNEYPDRWGPDRGIDLMFRHRNGDLWAVQAKCVASEHTITKAEIDSFLSESADARIHGRLLIASTDGIGRNAKATVERQEKQVVCYLLDQFRHSSVEFPNTPDDLRSGKRKELRVPRPHQVDAIEAVSSGLKDSARGQLIMACGTGKTLTSLWIKERLKAKRTLVLVPSLNLLSQTLREWTATASEPFDWLCVCSDASVAKKDDEWVSSTVEIGVPVTSDVEWIGAFLADSDSFVVFSTYQSSPLIAEAQDDLGIAAFDIVFADEAHRCAGKVSEAFGCVLDSERIRADKRLFMTATPRILSQQVKSASEGRGIEVASMDDRNVFGEVLHALNFSAAIEKDLLSDYRVVIVGVDDPMVRQKIENRDLVRTKTGVELDAETLGAHIGLAKSIKDFDLHRLITFHSRVKNAKEFSSDHGRVLDWLPQQNDAIGALVADYVSGDMNTSDRNRKLNRLRNLSHNERAILSNARCLSEGVDVPALDGVAFIDPRKSQVDIVQAVGRAIRKSENKKHGTIVIPVFIADHENAEAALESSAFKSVWNIVNALRSHDDVLTQELDFLRTTLGKRGAGDFDISGLAKIVIDLPESVEVNFISALKTRLVEQSTASWFFWYGLLLSYVEQEGHARTPAKYKSNDGFSLGVWVNKQRTTKSKLLRERVELLEAVDGWTWDVREAQWNEGYVHLKAYVEQEGHSSPPAKYKTNDGFKLGSWVSRQRFRKSSLDIEQIRLLEELRGWTWEALEIQWNEGYAHLKAYVEQEGHARTPAKYKSSDGFSLGVWVNTQRTTKSKLLRERVELLEAVDGWAWDVREAQWNEGYVHLKAYVEQEGHARPPATYKASDGYRLGSWVFHQRQSRDSLSSERAKRLEGLRGWDWDPRHTQWNDGYEHLKAYVEQEGHSSPPGKYKTNDGYRLGSWINKQRSRKSSLSIERTKLLEELPGWTWIARKDSQC